MPCQDCQPSPVHSLSQQTSSLTLSDSTQSGCKCCAKQDLVEPVRYYETSTPSSGCSCCNPRPYPPRPGPGRNCSCCSCRSCCSCCICCSNRPPFCAGARQLLPPAVQEANTDSCRVCAAKKEEEDRLRREEEARARREEETRIKREEEARARKEEEARGRKVCASCGCDKCA